MTLNGLQLTKVARPYAGGTRKCDLCLTEKLAIIKADPEFLRKTRDEFVSKCRYTNKFTLKLLKKKELMKYISSFFLRDLWGIVYVTTFKELLG